MTYISAAAARFAGALFGPRNAARLSQQPQQEEEGDSLVVKNTFYHCTTGGEVKDMRRTSSEPAGATGSLRTDSTSSDQDLVEAEKDAALEKGISQVNNKLTASSQRSLKAYAKDLILRTSSIDEAPDAEAEAEQEDWPDTPEYIANQPFGKASASGAASSTADPTASTDSASSALQDRLAGKGGLPAAQSAAASASSSLLLAKQAPPPSMRQGAEGAGGNSLKSTAIADLQALLQAAETSEHFRYPPGTQVLQWTHSEISSHSGQPTFRAVVAFFRDGVGHHVAGACGRSKRQARQSAADTALALFRCQWAAPPGDAPAACFVDTGALLCAENTGANKPASAADVGEFTMACMDGFKGRAGDPDNSGQSWAKPTWSCDSVGPGLWQALVELPLLGVSHTFSGPCCPTQELAIAEAARRILWYLGHPNYEGFYIPDGAALLAASCKVPDPPESWTNSSAALPLK
mmetsp:Transcript_8234/g.14756  ORF Transcript_8234/g.14756 Transcript_8234/m.14756 type:complete len:464 (+) Transcript_8234:142-1533(+)